MEKNTKTSNDVLLLESKNAKLNEDINALKISNQTLTLNIDNLQNQIITLQSEKNSLSKQISNNTQRNSAQSKTNILKNRNELLTKEVNALKTELAQLKKENEELNLLKTENQTLKIINGNLANKIEGASTSNGNAEENKMLKATIEEKNSQIAELKKQNEDWEKEYYNYLKQIDTLQQYIDQVHTENGSIEEINRLKKILTEKNDLIGRLQRQTKIYEEECNLVMEKESPVDMLKQIEILTSQIKSLQSQLNDLITYDRRIASFDDFIKVIEAIKKNSNDQSALSKLNYLIDFYKKNNEIIKNSLILEMHK